MYDEMTIEKIRRECESTSEVDDRPRGGSPVDFTTYLKGMVQSLKKGEVTEAEAIEALQASLGEWASFVASQDFYRVRDAVESWGFPGK